MEIRLDAATAHYMGEEPVQDAGDLGNGGGGGESFPEPVVQCSICSLQLCLRKTVTGKWMVSCQGYPNCQAAPLWFSSSVKEASVEATTCNSCNMGPHTVHLSLTRGSLAPFYPDQLSACLGGCDPDLLEMLGVGKLNSGAVVAPRPRQDDRGRGVRGAHRGGRGDPRGRGGRGDPRGGGGRGRGDPRGGGGGAMAVGRAAARPRAGRGRGGEGRGRGRGGSGDSDYDSGYNTQSQGASQAFQAKRQQLQELNGGVAPVQGLACNCGIPAASRTVRKDGPNKGRDFFCCSKPQGDQCGFFKFADEVVGSSNQGGGVAGAAYGGGAGFGGGGNVGGAVDAPVCQCGQVKVMRTVRKEGPTKDKQFFCCPKDREQQCQQSFQWADEVVPNAQEGGRGVGALGGGAGFGGGGVAGGRGQARGRGRGEKRMREAFGGEAGEKKQRKCGLCHQPGHTRNRWRVALFLTTEYCCIIIVLM